MALRGFLNAPSIDCFDSTHPFEEHDELPLSRCFTGQATRRMALGTILQMSTQDEQVSDESFEQVHQSAYGIAHLPVNDAGLTLTSSSKTDTLCPVQLNTPGLSAS